MHIAALTLYYSSHNPQWCFSCIGGGCIHAVAELKGKLYACSSLRLTLILSLCYFSQCIYTYVGVQSLQMQSRTVKKDDKDEAMTVTCMACIAWVHRRCKLKLHACVI